MSTPAINHEQFQNEFFSTLKPEGPIEQTFAFEIAGAAWRLQNCRIREAASELTDDEQKSTDRTRAQAQILMRRCLAELRLLQTERALRVELLPKGSDISLPALASIKEIAKTRKSAAKPELGSFCKNTSEPAPESESSSKPPANSPIPFPPPARTRPCPCHSGLKYKKCCGRNASPAPGQAA